MLKRISPLHDFARSRIEGTFDALFESARPRHSWKHAATLFDSVDDFRGVPVLVTVRHPASWILSLFRNPYHVFGERARTIEEFLDYRWATVGRERLGGRVFEPLALYQEKLRSYQVFADQLEAIGGSMLILKFEDIVIDQARVFEEIRGFLDISASGFKELTNSTKSSAKNLHYYREYYGREAWKDEMGSAYEAVCERFPRSLAESFGYAL